MDNCYHYSIIILYMHACYEHNYRYHLPCSTTHLRSVLPNKVMNSKSSKSLSYVYEVSGMNEALQSTIQWSFPQQMHLCSRSHGLGWRKHWPSLKEKQYEISEACEVDCEVGVPSCRKRFWGGPDCLQCWMWGGSNVDKMHSDLAWSGAMHLGHVRASTRWLRA